MAERCTAELPLKPSVRCELPTGHDGQHKLQEAGYTFSWAPQLYDYIRRDD